MGQWRALFFCNILKCVRLATNGVHHVANDAKRTFRQVEFGKQFHAKNHAICELGSTHDYMRTIAKKTEETADIRSPHAESSLFRRAINRNNLRGIDGFDV